MSPFQPAPRRPATELTVAGLDFEDRDRSRGFLISARHPEIGASGNGTIVYQRDARGNLTARDVTSDAGDRPLRFTYDGAGRAIKVEELISTGYRVLKEFFFARANIPGNSEKRRGQLVMARRTNWVAALTPLLVEGGVPLVVTDHYQYAGLGGRVSKKTTSLSLPSGSQSFTSEYTYGPLGDIASIDYPAGDWPHQSAPSRTVSYNRHLGFLTEIPGYASAITYQLGGMLEEIQYPNGARWRQTAEAATGWERPDKIETFSGSTLLWSTGDYGYDGACNISEIGDRGYVYDTFSRFSYVRNNGATPNEQQASYDAYGNLTSLARSGNTRVLTTNPATNRLAIAGTSYTSNGEVATAKIDGADFAYDYDGLGQQLFHRSDTKTWVYIYDANDERIFSWECVFDLCGENTSHERYTLRGLGGELLRAFEGKSRATIAWKEDYVYRDGQPLAWIKAPAEGGGEIHQYLHADHLGSTRLVTSATGTQVSRHDFLPFGEEATAVTGNDAALKFTGHERDQPGKPHDYMHARFYAPNFGRFLRTDPSQGSARPLAPQSWNRYSYAANNPLFFVDPDGAEIRVGFESQNFLKRALVQLARTPSGRGAIALLAGDTKFRVQIVSAQLKGNQSLKSKRVGTEVTVRFGLSTPVINAETDQTVGVILNIDKAATQRYHPTDKSGAVTLAHEMFHVFDMRDQKSVEEVIRNGDFPESGSGFAEMFGNAVLGEAQDWSETGARKFLEDMVIFEKRQR